MAAAASNTWWFVLSACTQVLLEPIAPCCQLKLCGCFFYWPQTTFASASFTGLSEGVHTLLVRAVSAPEGYLDPSPAELTFYVDSSAPVTTIADAAFPLTPSNQRSVIIYGAGLCPLAYTQVSRTGLIWKRDQVVLNSMESTSK